MRGEDIVSCIVERLGQVQFFLLKRSQGNWQLETYETKSLKIKRLHVEEGERRLKLGHGVGSSKEKKW